MIDIGLDVDEVVADLHRPWLQWLTVRFGSSLTSFKYWDHPTDAFGPEALAFIHPLIYDTNVVRPYPLAVDAVELLRLSGHTITWVSKCLNGTKEAKWAWLLRNRLAFLGDAFHAVEDTKDFGMDLLVDDSVQWARTFPGTTILINRSHNAHEPYIGPRADSLYDVAKSIHLCGLEETLMRFSALERGSLPPV